MKVLFIFLVQFITVCLLIKLAIRMVVPRPLRKLFLKSSVTLYHTSANLLKAMKTNFEDESDDDSDDIIEEDSNVISISRASKK